MYTWETLHLYLVTECNQRDPRGLLNDSVQELRPRTDKQDGLLDVMQFIKHPEIRQDAITISAQSALSALETIVHRRRLLTYLPTQYRRNIRNWLMTYHAHQ